MAILYGPKKANSKYLYLKHSSLIQCPERCRVCDGKGSRPSLENPSNLLRMNNPCSIRRIKVQSLFGSLSFLQDRKRVALGMRSSPVIPLNSSPEEQRNSVPLEEVRSSASVPVATPLLQGSSALILHFPTTPESCSAPPQNSSDSVSHSQCLRNSCWFFLLCFGRAPSAVPAARLLRKNVPENSWQEKSQHSSSLSRRPTHVRLSRASSLCSLHTGCRWPPCIFIFICISGTDLRLRP